VQDLHQAGQERGQVRLHRQELPDRPEEGEAGGPDGGGPGWRLNGTGEEPGESQTALRETASQTGTWSRMTRILIMTSFNYSA